MGLSSLLPRLREDLGQRDFPAFSDFIKRRPFVVVPLERGFAHATVLIEPSGTLDACQ
jgi:hypothetical protein